MRHAIKQTNKLFFTDQFFYILDGQVFKETADIALVHIHPDYGVYQQSLLTN